MIKGIVENNEMKIKKINEKLSLAGLVFTGFMLGAIGKVFAVVSGGWSDGLTNAEGFGLPDPSEGIYGIVENILGWLLTIVGIVGVIGFVISGLMYLTSAGEEAKIKVAKSAMTASIMGVIVAICGVVVLKAVTAMLEADGPF
ncbi:MAG: hypothetical protein WAV73_03115 [Candidatus Moraniibacteriota bacterium]